MSDLAHLLLQTMKVCRARSGKAGAMPELTIPQIRTLVTIGREGPLPISHLSQLLHSDESVISRAVHSLVDKELVSRSEDPQDRRRKTVAITDTGSDLLQQMWEIHIQVMHELVDDFPNADELAPLLQQLLTHIQQKDHIV